MAPQINIMPLARQAVAFAGVRLNLQGTTLKTPHRAIGEQRKATWPMVWNTTRHQGGNQVFIRFRAPNNEPAPVHEIKGTE